MMTPPDVKAPSRFPRSPELESSDFAALASHMTEFDRSLGRFFTVRSVLESLHAMTAPRMVTTGALLLGCILALIVLTLA